MFEPEKRAATARKDNRKARAVMLSSIGYSVEEMAKLMKVSKRSIERYLR